MSEAPPPAFADHAHEYGQTEALIFFIQGPGNTEFDDLEFSPESIPEPSEYALIDLGVIFFGVWRHKVLTTNRVYKTLAIRL